MPLEKLFVELQKLTHALLRIAVHWKWILTFFHCVTLETQLLSTSSECTLMEMAYTLDMTATSFHQFNRSCVTLGHNNSIHFALKMPD